MWVGVCVRVNAVHVKLHAARAFFISLINIWILKLYSEKVCDLSTIFWYASPHLRLFTIFYLHGIPRGARKFKSCVSASLVRFILPGKSIKEQEELFMTVNILEKYEMGSAMFLQSKLIWRENNKLLFEADKFSKKNLFWDSKFCGRIIARLFDIWIILTNSQ